MLKHDPTVPLTWMSTLRLVYSILKENLQVVNIGCRDFELSRGHGLSYYECCDSHQPRNDLDLLTFEFKKE